MSLEVHKLKQVNNLLRCQHYYCCRKLCQKSTSSENQMAKVQCEICQRIIDRIFGDRSLYKHTSQIGNNSEKHSTPIKAQLLAQFQAVPSRLIKLKRIISKSFTGARSYESKGGILTNGNNSELQTLTDSKLLTHGIPEEIETKEVIQLVNQSRRRKHLVKRLDKRNKNKINRRDREPPKHLPQPHSPKPSPKYLSPIFEPTLTDKPLFMIDKQQSDQHSLFKEGIVLESREQIINTNNDTYCASEIEQLHKEDFVLTNIVDENVLIPDSAETKIGNFEDVYEPKSVVQQVIKMIANTHIGHKYAEVNTQEGKRVLPENSDKTLNPTFIPCLMDKPINRMNENHNIKLTHCPQEDVVLQHRENVIPTNDDNNYSTNKIQSLHMENLVVANVVDETVLTTKITTDSNKTDIMDEIFKSKFAVKQPIESIVNTNAICSKESTKTKGKVSLEALLKTVREENLKATCNETVKCKSKKKPPCPPPPPACPPSAPTPPCPTPCPKPPPKPTQCPSTPKCPPPKKCFHNLKDYWPVLNLNNNKADSLDTENCDKNIESTVVIVKDILNRITGTSLNICLLRSFEPWTPIPSWPTPREELPRVNPNKSKYCRLPALRPNERCKAGPCLGYPKQKLNK